MRKKLGLLMVVGLVVSMLVAAIPAYAVNPDPTNAANIGLRWSYDVTYNFPGGYGAPPALVVDREVRELVAINQLPPNPATYDPVKCPHSPPFSPFTKSAIATTPGYQVTYCWDAGSLARFYDYGFLVPLDLFGFDYIRDNADTQMNWELMQMNAWVTAPPPAPPMPLGAAMWYTNKAGTYWPRAIGTFFSYDAESCNPVTGIGITSWQGGIIVGPPGPAAQPVTVVVPAGTFTCWQESHISTYQMDEYWDINGVFDIDYIKRSNARWMGSELHELSCYPGGPSAPCGPCVPEMTTIGLVLMGMLGMAGFVWYRSRRLQLD